VREGRFAIALERLDERHELREHNSLEFDLTRAELCLELGLTASATNLAKGSLGKRSINSEQRARAHKVLAIAAFYQGDVVGSVDMLRHAVASVKDLKSCQLRALVFLTDFAVRLNTEPIETGLARLGDIRKAVLAAADPHLMVLLRIAVARAEARRLSPLEAQRHHLAAMALLAVEPNVWLEGLLHIDMAAIAMILSDLPTSLAHGTRAIELARESGHARTRLAAIINLSQVLTWQGEFERAGQYIDEALQSEYDNRHLRRSALDSLANLLVSKGNYDDCKRVLRGLAGETDGVSSKRPHWDTSTEAFSMARLAQAEGKLDEALEYLNRALSIAESCGDQIWIRRIRTTRVRALGLLGRVDDAIGDLDEIHRVELRDPESISRYYGALATVEEADGKPGHARLHLRRASRIAGAMTNEALRRDHEDGFYGTLSVPREGEQRTTPSILSGLDSAVALLELSGYPQVFGREVYALLDDSGCSEQLALAATGPQGPRLIAAAGWTGDEALAALAAAPPDHLLVVGQHRDETWQVLATPKPALDDRCTYAAVRKLVATARALDQFRRDEKQRAALWPAEDLEGDAESLWISEQSSELLRIARRIANAPLAVLLTGETGTGKEMLARVIHRASDRADRPLQPFNCAAVPRDMLDSQLFGYRKGSFTGADGSFPGVIRAAAGGTLFLDEIGDVGPELQPKLLRFLEQHEVHPLGEPHALTVDVRIIAATNANLDRLVAEGRFREDLYYRLKVLHLHLPPLRERREEIPALTQHYIRKISDEMKKGQLVLGDETLEYLLLYPWPGNIRQLANEMRRMIALAEPDSALTPSLLSQEILASRRTVAVTPAAEPEIRLRLDQPLPTAIETLEQTLIRRALERSHGRVEEAAKLLGISRKGLFLKRRRWGLRQAS
jgi:DNA-binding NtrC family response regulator/tetratricopeptide (TPR) repeat protein